MDEPQGEYSPRILTEDLPKSTELRWQSTPPRKVALTRREMLRRLSETRKDLAEELPPTPKTLKKPPFQPTRRQALKYGAGALAAIAAAKTLDIKPWEWLDVLHALGDQSPVPAVPEAVPAAVVNPNQPVAKESIPTKTDTFELVFQDLSPNDLERARKTVDVLKKQFASSLARGSPLAVANKWESVIRENAHRVGFPEELALGIVLIENGGGEAEVSWAKARGITQLMPGTAKFYGLVVNDKNDERTDPTKSIPVMCNYLRDNLGRFAGNLGLTTWSYHAGETNVYSALREYFIDTGHPDPGKITTGDYNEALVIMENYRRLIRGSKVNILDVLSNPRVKKNVLSTLEDETELYTYKTVAAASFFENRGSLATANTTLP